MTDSAISNTSEEEDEELEEDLGDLDDLLESLKKEDEPTHNSPHPTLNNQIRI